MQHVVIRRDDYVDGSSGRIGQYIKSALQVLEDNGGSLRSRGVRDPSLVANA
jgi:hypothetical protein